MKTCYNYVTLRYVHDPITQEFANVGVVLYAAQSRHLEACFSSRYSRLNDMFLRIDHNHFRAQMRYLSQAFEELGLEIREGDLVGRQDSKIEDLVRRVLPADDSSLQWSKSAGGFSDDLSVTVKQLFARQVERYVESPDSGSRTDEEVARPFKATLEEKKVSGLVEQKRIVAKDYDYEFQFAWKNSIWHLYEPVSFDLLDPNSIREKANRWLGRCTALQDAAEKYKIYFLLGEPRRSDVNEAFLNAQHLLEKIPGQKQLVPEKELKQFSENVAEEIAEHSRIDGSGDE
jgi:hypothetical protein